MLLVTTIHHFLSSKEMNISHMAQTLRFQFLLIKISFLELHHQVHTTSLLIFHLNNLNFVQILHYYLVLI